MVRFTVGCLPRRHSSKGYRRVQRRASANEYVTHGYCRDAHRRSGTDSDSFGVSRLRVRLGRQFLHRAVRLATTVNGVRGSRGVHRRRAKSSSEELDSEETTGFGVDLSSDDVYVDHRDERSGVSARRDVRSSGSGPVRCTPAKVSRSTPRPGRSTRRDATNQEVDVFTAFAVPDVQHRWRVERSRKPAVTVGGVVNPDGLPVTSCVFEYGPSTSYGQSEPCAQEPVADRLGQSGRSR